MIRDLLEEQELVTCEPDARVAEVARLMADRNVGAVLVLTRDKPRGIITDRDITVRCVGRNLDVNDTTVEQVLTESPETVEHTAGIFDCIQKMREARVRRMPVVDEEGRAVGIISFSDLLGILSKELVALAAATTPREDQGGDVGRLSAA